MDEINNIPLGFYKHFKGGIYEVLMIVNHSETLEKHVVYKHLDFLIGYGMDSGWTRPLKMFVELVDGKPRFEYIGKEIK